MKKLFLILLTMVGVLSAQAADYPYLTFETVDGAKVSVSVSSLTVTISGTTLTAGSKTFEVDNLSKMYFTATDETSTDICEITAVNIDETTEIYDLQGHKVSKDQMRRGIYIVKTNQGTFKMTVK